MHPDNILSALHESAHVSFPKNRRKKGCYYPILHMRIWKQVCTFHTWVRIWVQSHVERQGDWAQSSQSLTHSACLPIRKMHNHHPGLLSGGSEVAFWQWRCFALVMDTLLLKWEAVLLPPVPKNVDLFFSRSPIPTAGSNVPTQCEKYSSHLS